MPRHELRRLTYAVELASKNLKHDEGEAELAQRSTDVSAFEGALSGTDLDEFLRREHNGAGAVKAQVVAVLCVSSLTRMLVEI